ncbi:hypothetical protein LXA43DRAFT_904703, partial [Ganoderma leucocontextum]
LTTYCFFATIAGIVRRNQELLTSGGEDRSERARRLMTKMVNALTAAAEIGGPAASAALLGLPDHYMNHTFKTVFWYSYIFRAQESGPMTVQRLELDRDWTSKDRTGAVPMSKVNDYQFRPTVFEHLTLYDYLRTTDVRKLRKNEQFAEATVDGGAGLEAGAIDEDTESDRPTMSAFRFHSDHPSCDTHRVFVRPPQDAYTINFTGRLLPRSDKGNQEEYCFTMLVLFAPGGWCSSVNLQGDSASWRARFDSVDFAPAHRDVMQKMQVLYTARFESGGQCLEHAYGPAALTSCPPLERHLVIV